MENQLPENAAASPGQQQAAGPETIDNTVSISTPQNELTSGTLSDSGKGSASATAKASRKRTKTGCLSQYTHLLVPARGQC